MQREIPFDVKLPSSRPLEAEVLSETQFNEELEKGYSDYLSGNLKVAESAFKEICKDYNL